MNNEVKEILDNIKEDINGKFEWEYIDGYYVEQIKPLLDYITNLQQENEYLKKQNDDKTRIGVADHKYASQMEDKVILLQQENERLKEDLKGQENLTKSYCKSEQDYKSRIEKAVEYYKTHQQECVVGRNRDDKLIKDYYLPARCSKVLLNILQNGSDKE